jgi:putative oxidoreductase
MQSLEKLKPLALLMLRLGLGAIFIYHGYPKLFDNTREVMGNFVHMGFPAYFAYIAGAIEFFGGCLLVAGLFTRIAGLLLAGEMAVAVVQVHKLFAEPRAVHNYEFPLALALAAFTLTAVGAGAISLDAAIYGDGRGGRSASRKARTKD